MNKRFLGELRPPADDVQRTIAEEIMDCRKVPGGMDDSVWMAEQIMDAIKDAGWVIVRVPQNTD